jgi:hypothetical protein
VPRLLCVSLFWLFFKTDLHFATISHKNDDDGDALNEEQQCWKDEQVSARIIALCSSLQNPYSHNLLLLLSFFHHPDSSCSLSCYSLLVPLLHDAALPCCLIATSFSDLDPSILSLLLLGGAVCTTILINHNVTSN